MKKLLVLMRLMILLLCVMSVISIIVVMNQLKDKILYYRIRIDISEYMQMFEDHMIELC